jgi:hypothetical protein
MKELVNQMSTGLSLTVLSFDTRKFAQSLEQQQTYERDNDNHGNDVERERPAVEREANDGDENGLNLIDEFSVDAILRSPRASKNRSTRRRRQRTSSKALSDNGDKENEMHIGVETDE